MSDGQSKKSPMSRFFERISKTWLVRKLEHEHFILIGVAAVLLLSYFTYGYITAPDEPGIAVVSGTEYISGEEGQAIVRVTDPKGNPIPVANCTVTILYPDKSYFIIDTQMIASSIPGNYYKAFTTPSTIGIYEETFDCIATRNFQEFRLRVSSSFHVSYALNYLLEMDARETQHYLDIVHRLDLIGADLGNMNSSIENISKEVDGIESHLGTVDSTLSTLNNAIMVTTTTMNQKFASIYEDFASLGSSMSNIFND